MEDMQAKLTKQFDLAWQGRLMQPKVVSPRTAQKQKQSLFGLIGCMQVKPKQTNLAIPTILPSERFSPRNIIDKTQSSLGSGVSNSTKSSNEVVMDSSVLKDLLSDENQTKLCKVVFSPECFYVGDFVDDKRVGVGIQF